MAEATTPYFVWAAACTGEAEFMTSAPQLSEEFTRHEINLSTLTLRQGHKLNHERNQVKFEYDISANDNGVLQMERAFLKEEC